MKVYLTFMVLTLSGCQTSYDKSKTIALVNREPITVSELEQALLKVDQHTVNRFESDDEKKELAQELIEQELLFQKALEDKIHHRSLDIKSIIVATYLKEFVSKIAFEPTKTQVEEHFHQNKDKIESVRVSHILIRVDPNQIKREASLKKAKHIEQLFSKNKSTANFESLAKQFSEDESTKSKGGDLGWIKRNQGVQYFSQAAFDIQDVGQTSPITQTELGFHIILLTQEQRGFDKHFEQIKSHLIKVKHKHEVDQLLLDLKSKSDIATYFENISKAVKPITVIKGNDQ